MMCYMYKHLKEMHENTSTSEKVFHLIVIYSRPWSRPNISRAMKLYSNLLRLTLKNTIELEI